MLSQPQVATCVRYRLQIVGWAHRRAGAPCASV